jgi:hypothetical protein
MSMSRDPLADLGELFGHQVAMHSRRYGKVTHWWVVCSCGFSTEDSAGKSYLRHLENGAGHLRRVGQKLDRESGNTPPARNAAKRTRSRSKLATPVEHAPGTR